MSARDPERRSGRRTPGLGEAVLVGRGGREKARLLDLSPSGAALAIGDPAGWPLGSPAGLELELDGRLWTIEGWIARRADSALALAFDDPPADTRAAIERMLSGPRR